MVGVKEMTLLKRITIIFASVTVISSLSFYFIGNSVVEQISSGEIDKSVIRLERVLDAINDDVAYIDSKVTDIVHDFELSYLFCEMDILEEVSDILGADIAERDNYIKRINNVLFLDKEFKVHDILKGSKKEIESLVFQTVLSEIETIISKNKTLVTGIINIDKDAFIVGVKELKLNANNLGYLAIIEPIDIDYIKSINSEDLNAYELSISMFKDTTNMVDYIQSNKSNLDFYSVKGEKYIDTYSKINSINQNDSNVYIGLRDTREVKDAAQKGINGLLLLVITFTIIANIIVYILIKKGVVLRILNINKAINSVKEGTHLNLEIIDTSDNTDEISKLKKDINDMFKRLKNYSDNLHYIGSHDSLTGIENRYSITRYISKLTRRGDEFALLFIDLDNFKVINDNLGHEVGDNLLIKVSADLVGIKKECKNIAVGRLGGDEFIIVRKGRNSEEEIKKLARKVLNRINKLYEISSYNYEIKASMGISFYPQHSIEEGELLQYSDIAMYCSKEKGGNNFEVFDFKMLEALRIEKMLKSAINNDEFEAYLQPIFSIKKNKIKGFESLIRWHKDGELIPPDKFIHIAKKQVILLILIITCLEGRLRYVGKF